MKAIISHDVDHNKVSDHLTDGILIKFWLRNFYELLTGSVGPVNVINMIEEMLSDRWQYIDQLMRYDRERRVPATYFVGVNQGLGLSYSLASASCLIDSITKGGFEVGVHGICFDNFDGIQEEHKRFKRLSTRDVFGIRMHYLRVGENTLTSLARAGYAYDSSLYQLSAPFMLDNLVEFPLHLMDVRVLYQEERYKTVSLQKAQEFTRKVIDQVASAGLPYLTILFHDRYFCNTYGKWRDWYMWTIEYLQGQGVEFIDYKNARLEFINTIS